MSPGTTSRTCSKVSRGGGGGRVREGVGRAGCVSRVERGGRGRGLWGTAGRGVCEGRGWARRAAWEGRGRGDAGRREGRSGTGGGGATEGASVVPGSERRSPRSPHGRASRRRRSAVTGEDCGRLCLREGGAAAELMVPGSLSGQREGSGSPESCTLHGMWRCPVRGRCWKRRVGCAIAPC